MENHPQAISFANSYFSLVDGLAPGLESHLAEDVVLDWFGRTIRGRKNVAAFIKDHKVASRHVFNNITPATCINYKKSRKSRRPKIDNYVSSMMKRVSISDVDPDNNNDSSVLDCEGNLQEQIDNDDFSNTYDLASLFALEIITPTQEDEIEENIKKIENDPEVEESVRNVKYVEANGQIEFSKKSIKRGTELQTWKRQSKLQIAYSVVSGEINDQGMETEEISVPEIEHRTLLPSLEEITEIGNNLVPNINNFGGYFPCFDFNEERDKFLDNFNAELTLRNAQASLRTPQYVENRLVFGSDLNTKPKNIDKYDNNRFVFNYLIHLIIYQGNSRCRRSLCQEFESDTIKQDEKRFVTEVKN